MYAQLHEFSVFGGFVQSNLTPKVGKISDRFFLREGRGVGGVSFGLSYSRGQPRNQHKVGWDPKYWIMAEASICRCGGNMSAAISLPNGTRTLQNLTYVFYRGDYNLKFVLGSKKLRFYAGPSITNAFYAGFRRDQESSLVSATRYFSGFTFGYEAGIGLAFKRISLSGRYQNFVTDFGNSFSGTPASIKIRDIRIILSYKIAEKHKGAYWDSIDWDK